MFYISLPLSLTRARIYRPSFRENKHKTLVFSHWNERFELFIFRKYGYMTDIFLWLRKPLLNCLVTNYHLYTPFQRTAQCTATKFGSCGSCWPRTTCWSQPATSSATIRPAGSGTVATSQPPPWSSSGTSGTTPFSGQIFYNYIRAIWKRPETFEVPVSVIHWFLPKKWSTKSQVSVPGYMKGKY